MGRIDAFGRTTTPVRRLHGFADGMSCAAGVLALPDVDVACMGVLVPAVAATPWTARPTGDHSQPHRYLAGRGSPALSQAALADERASRHKVCLGSRP